MSTNQDIWNLLEEYQIGDTFLAEKYEEISPENRSRIKTAIAFHFSLHKAQNEEELYYSHRNSGLFYGIHQKAAPFLVCVLEEGFASPAQLLATICPAVIAGVENIFIFLAQNTADSILGSLELCGIENIYLLHENTSKKQEEENIQIIINSLGLLIKNNQNEAGRLVLFSKCEHINDSFISLEEASSKLSIRAHIEKHSPSVYAEQKNHNYINFAYTSPRLMHSDTLYSESMTDELTHNDHTKLHTDNSAEAFTKHRHKAAIKFSVSQNPIADISFIPNKLGAQNYEGGMELCYLHASIDTNFFLNKKISAQMPCTDVS